MTGLIDYIRKPFDLLYGYTSDETDTHGVYDDTRSKDGLYSITSTQSGESTYAAYEPETEQETFGSEPATETEMVDCEPVVADD